MVFACQHFDNMLCVVPLAISLPLICVWLCVYSSAIGVIQRGPEPSRGQDMDSNNPEDAIRRVVYMNLALQFVMFALNTLGWISGLTIEWVVTYDVYVFTFVLIFQAVFFFTMQLNLLLAAYLLLFSKNHVDNPAAPSVGSTEVGMRVEGV